jgi:predicted small secreted protein
MSKVNANDGNRKVVRKEDLRIMKHIVAVLACLFLCTGCNPWKTTKGVYEDYINPAPELCLDVNETCSPDELHQASVFGPVDIRLDALQENMVSRDSFPGDRWFAETRRAFPWLGVLTAMDMTGDVLVDAAEYNDLPAEAFLQYGEAWNDRAPRMVVDSTGGGLRVFLGTPFFRGTTLQGVLVAGFDPELMAGFSPAPDSLGIITDGAPAWLGAEVAYTVSATEPDWDRMLASDVRGRIAAGTGDVAWLGRRYGHKWIVYLVSM